MINQELVIKVNEIFHNIEGAQYEEQHPEIIKEEISRWKNIAKDYFISNLPLKILDIGTGTGFVPQQIIDYLKPSDFLICADVSQNILEVCKKKITPLAKCGLMFVKIEGGGLPFNDNSINIATMNSVLHHIPNTDGIFKEIDRILAPGAFLIIAHEPNKNFFNNKFLWNNYKFWRIVFNPAALISGIARHFGFSRIYSFYVQYRRKHHPNYFEKLTNEVNHRLIAERIISNPLTPGELGQLVDVYSESGFDIAGISRNNLPNYKIRLLKTYNHLYRLSMHQGNQFVRKLDCLLKKYYPEDGATFLAVFEKE